MPFQLSDGKENSHNTNEEKIYDVFYPKYKLSDLIVSEECLNQLNSLLSRIRYHDLVYVHWNLSSVLPDQQSILANFYGDSGTGKTMAAHAIANALQMPLLIVNYAEIESKYVGETPKNLVRLFQFASENHVIILFDEADALLSRRVTDMHSAADVSVNQTRSVLLTQLEKYKGIILFTTNFIANYDSAFMRRIALHIHFTLPNAMLRQKIWEKYIPSQMPAEIDFKAIADSYEGISGADIANAVVSAAFAAAKEKRDIIPQEYFERAISDIIVAKQCNRSTIASMKTRTVDANYVYQQIGTKERGSSHAIY